MKKNSFAIVTLLLAVVTLAGAAQTAEIVSRHGIQAGMVGGYASSEYNIGGLGGEYEIEIAMSKAASLGLSGGGGYNMSTGSLALGGLDLKYSLLNDKQLDLGLVGYGRGCYLFATKDPSKYFYGGGALALATLNVGYFTITGGGGASYDIYADSNGKSANQIAPVAIVNLKFPLSKTSDIGLAFEYSGDRFFLGAVVDFNISQPVAKAAAAPAKKPAPAPSKPAPAKPKK